MSCCERSRVWVDERAVVVWIPAFAGMTVLYSQLQRSAKGVNYVS